MTKPLSWFSTWLPLIKVAQAICQLVVIVMFMDGREQWWVYNQVFLVAFLALFFSFFSILLQYVEVHGAHMSFTVMEMICNVLFTITSFGLAAVLLWDIWNMRHGPARYKYHHRLAPVHIGHEAWMRRCATAAGSLLLAGILYIITHLKLLGSRD